MRPSAVYELLCLIRRATTHSLSRCSLSGVAQKNYDLIVLGGGSGGLACGKEAATFGRKVAVVDFVEPTIAGTSWGLGGTCVNVGCIPKKLMHHAGLVGITLHDAKHYGWHINQENVKHNWAILRDNVQGYIRSLNWGYRIQLQEKKIDYFNALATFVDKRTIRVKSKKGSDSYLVADHIVIATGGRPKYPEIDGAEYGISSDDLFSLKSSPGNTLVVGGSYVALECAGFLASLKFPVTLMIRSIPLRGYDQEIAAMIKDSLVSHGVKIIDKSIPIRVEESKNGTFRVFFVGSDQKTDVASFDTVLWAIGRKPRLEEMGLENAGVKVHDSGKLVVDQFEMTNVDGIFAIGDVQNGRPELTPVAIMAGKLLARRLFGECKVAMDYSKIPTTVFTPLEYGTVGFSEEECLENFGEEHIEVFHAFYTPLEFALSHRDEGKCYLKIICERKHPRRILGLHFLGPSAGEVVQGFATALRLNATVDDLQNTVGIHPTCAEEFVKLRITKRSGEKATVSGC